MLGLLNPNMRSPPPTRKHSPAQLPSFAPGHRICHSSYLQVLKVGGQGLRSVGGQPIALKPPSQNCSSWAGGGSLDFQGRKNLDVGLSPLSPLKVISIAAASAGQDAEAGSR